MEEREILAVLEARETEEHPDSVDLMVSLEVPVPPEPRESPCPVCLELRETLVPLELPDETERRETLAREAEMETPDLWE